MGFLGKLKNLFFGGDTSQINYLEGVAIDMKNAGYVKTWEVVKSLADRENKELGEYLYSILPEKDVMKFFSGPFVEDERNYEVLRDFIINYLDKKDVGELKYEVDSLLEEKEESREEFIERTKDKFERETRND